MDGAELSEVVREHPASTPTRQAASSRSSPIVAPPGRGHAASRHGSGIAPRKAPSAGARARVVHLVDRPSDTFERMLGVGDGPGPGRAPTWKCPANRPSSCAVLSESTDGWGHGCGVRRRTGLARARPPRRTIGPPAWALPAAARGRSRLPAVPARGLGLHAVAAAARAAEPRLGADARQPVVADGERVTAARHLRGIGARVRAPGSPAHARRGRAPSTSSANPTARTWYRAHNAVDRLGVPGQRGPGPPGGPRRAVLHQPGARPGALRARARRRRPARARLAGALRPAARRPSAGHHRHLPVPVARAARPTTPSTSDLESYVVAEHGLGHLARRRHHRAQARPALRLVGRCARDLGLRALLDPGRGVPSYAWDPEMPLRGTPHPPCSPASPGVRRARSPVARRRVRRRADEREGARATTASSVPRDLCGSGRRGQKASRPTTEVAQVHPTLVGRGRQTRSQVQCLVELRSSDGGLLAHVAKNRCLGP